MELQGPPSPAAAPGTARTDEVVIAAVLAGDTPMFELIMRRYNQRLFRVARAITRSPHEAEDVVQEAYVSAFSHLSEFAGRAAFGTWLTRICVHEALRRVRREKSYVRTDANEENGTEEALMSSSFPSGAPTPEEQTSSRELGELLERTIDELPEAFRTVFVLRAVEQLSVAETAACLEVPEETVKTRFFRARALLREDLAQRMETQAPRVFSFDGARCDRIVASVLARVGAGE